MWEKVFGVFKRIFTFNDELKKLQADSDLHAEQIKELYANQTRFQYELQLQKERDAHERERILHQLQLANKDRIESEQRIEIQQLREQVARLSLPPSAPKPPDEPSND